MNKIVAELESQQLQRLTENKTIPAFRPGDSLRVMVRIKEGNNSRLQAFEGVCIGRQGSGVRELFTVRKVVAGCGIERMFPLYSPSLESIEVVRYGRVRRAKLYYLRERSGKSARIKERLGMRHKMNKSA